MSAEWICTGSFIGSLWLEDIDFYLAQAKKRNVKLHVQLLFEDWSAERSLLSDFIYFDFFFYCDCVQHYS